MLKGKQILIGITGGIAAYKITFLIRLLKKKGCDVKCIVTPDALDFVTPLTLSTLSQNPVFIDFWNKENGTWNSHVELGRWADLFLIAPLTANTLSKLSNGYCDNLLTATYLSAKCPVYVAPAMDLDMYAHPTTKSNLIRLKKHNVNIIPAEKGFLASGLTGKGRMAEPESIIGEIEYHFSVTGSMLGEKVVITAGPTYEAIDPVRFIGNYSSGKMGFSIAEECLNRGAKVILISGPTNCSLHHENLTLVTITSADELLDKAMHYFPQCTGGIFAAAVSDYRPKVKASQKIKKKDETMELTLVKNPDILKEIGAKKAENQWLVGFALETNEALKHGAEKLKKKNLDFIVINSLEDEQSGFGYDTNKITLLDKYNKTTKFELSTKKVAARNIINYLLKANQ